MAKHALQFVRRTPPGGFLFLVAVALSWGPGLGWAGQQPPAPGIKPGVTAGQKGLRTKAIKSLQGPAQRKSALPSTVASGRRDPFKVPDFSVSKIEASHLSMTVANGAPPPGARGLLIAQLRLEGVVREESSRKMIAVVTNQTRRAYFLTENEAVYDGIVSRITPDSVSFQENVVDPHGHLTTQEVVKRLGSASGEGR